MLGFIQKIIVAFIVLLLSSPSFAWSRSLAEPSQTQEVKHGYVQVVERRQRRIRRTRKQRPTYRKAKQSRRFKRRGNSSRRYRGRQPTYKKKRPARRGSDVNRPRRGGVRPKFVRPRRGSGETRPRKQPRPRVQTSSPKIKTPRGRPDNHAGTSPRGNKQKPGRFVRDRRGVVKFTPKDTKGKKTVKGTRVQRRNPNIQSEGKIDNFGGTSPYTASQPKKKERYKRDRVSPNSDTKQLGARNTPTVHSHTSSAPKPTNQNRYSDTYPVPPKQVAPSKITNHKPLENPSSISQKFSDRGTVSNGILVPSVEAKKKQGWFGWLSKKAEAFNNWATFGGYDKMKDTVKSGARRAAQKVRENGGHSIGTTINAVKEIGGSAAVGTGRVVGGAIVRGTELTPAGGVKKGIAKNSGKVINRVKGVIFDREAVSRKIANGHAFDQHILDKREFIGLGIRTRKQFTQHIDNVMKRSTVKKKLERGRIAFWDEKTRTVVIFDPSRKDNGTAFRARDGFDYISRLK